MPATDDMPSLREVQERLAEAILRPDDLGVAAVVPMLRQPSRGTVQDRLHAHIDGYPARVHEALAEIYPAVLHVVGTRRFHDLVHRLLRSTTLSSYNLNDAGADLPAYLQRDELREAFPFLPDLALLELRVRRAFDAHIRPPLDRAKLAALDSDDWPHVVLGLQPETVIVRSRWPIRDIWEARNTQREEIDIDLRRRQDRILVYRAGFSVTCRSLSEEEADTLEGLLAGRTLGDVSALLAADGGTVEAVSAWFASWMAIGLITDCLRRHDRGGAGVLEEERPRLRRRRTARRRTRWGLG